MEKMCEKCTLKMIYKLLWYGLTTKKIELKFLNLKKAQILAKFENVENFVVRREKICSQIGEKKLLFGNRRPFAVMYFALSHF